MPVTARLSKRLYDRLGDEIANDLAEWRYTHTAGDTFEKSVADILLHVALHGQYHGGKVNLLLRQAGLSPFVRGAPAATQADQPPSQHAK